jgi:hypothetical protein
MAPPRATGRRHFVVKFWPVVPLLRFVSSFVLQSLAAWWIIGAGRNRPETADSSFP